jgi:hypothetical protein
LPRKTKTTLDGRMVWSRELKNIRKENPRLMEALDQAEHLDRCIDRILEQQWYGQDKLQYFTNMHNLETCQRLKSEILKEKKK